MSFVEVAVAMPVRGLFTYKAPPDLGLAMGHVVQVPFGRQKVTGYVIRTTDSSNVPRLKSVIKLVDQEPAFDSTQLRFFEWISRYYLSALGEVIATALPARYRSKVRRVYMPTEDGIEALATGAIEEGPHAQVLREVIARPGRTRTGLARSLHEELENKLVAKSIDALIRRQWISVEERQVGEKSGKITTVQLTVSPDSIPMEGGIRMRGVLARLAEAGGQLDLATLIEQEGSSARDAVRRLEGKGLVVRSEREDRTAITDEGMSDHGVAPRLNPEQETALQTILDTNNGTCLLHGVTGSGKTEVYLQATKSIIESGKQVLVLVPEIALTPQLLGRFRARFGDRVAVLHSGLTPTQRLREWRRIRAREADVAIGARSALFAPFHALGLIVVDEEHDASYKQDDGVVYHARDMAISRASIENIPIHLITSIPS
ncbi:MAG: DEAD/DEAH box helicase, partial [Myxococcota bacterium]